ncbi:helicase C-terminal domain-containing protein [Paraburkholderia strydomiana]|uniref:Helicase C-terminal domain-containing protein n=1 Tax=Paraburkholderia strydomiana TaxID=1245417 RepID=A0ABW9BWG7_9BURK
MLVLFSGRRLEIAPRCLPIEQIPSFARAKRKIYMTATLADDGILISHLGADPGAVADPLRPKGAGEIGDRMIIAPQEVNPEIFDKDVKTFAADIAKQHNVVVLVPSRKRAEFWDDVSDQTLDKDTIAAGVAKLRAAHVGLTVLINRYDGVDLPDDACRLLIVDGLPESMGLLDSIESSALEGTKQQLLRQIQRLEQGMGRGVRSGEDRCAVLLFGARLTQRVNQPDARGMFTAATLVQIDMGKEVTRQLKGKPIDELRPILDYCIRRDDANGQKWWQAARTRLAKAKEGPVSHVDGSVAALRQAFEFAVNGQSLQAFETVQNAAREEGDKIVRGYLMQQMAEYRHQTNAAEAQKILLSANALNSHVLRPLAGISYAKLSSPAKGQAEAAETFMRERFVEPNEFVLWVHSVVADLVWDKDKTERFEAAMQELGLLLGFGSQRPDKQYKNGGPDNLWALGELTFLVIECKSGVDNDGTLVSKDHCNQLLGAKSWFDAAYDQTCKATPVLVHPQTKFQAEASPSLDMRVLSTKGLSALRDALRAYVKSVGEHARFPTVAEIQVQFERYGLSRQQFVGKFTEKPRQTPK